MANLFGFEIRRARDQEEEQKTQPSFAPEIKDDGAVVVAAGGSYGTYIDLQGAARTEAELVTKYREMSMHPEVERAVDDVVNEAIVVEKNKSTVSINLDDTNLSPAIKKLVKKEFEAILSLLNFNKTAFDIFKRWYIDGRMYYHIIIDVNDPSSGIKELRYIDPRKLRKVREIKRKTDTKSRIPQTSTVQEYFVYNEKGFQNKAGEVGTATSVTGLKIAQDSIIHITSGILDPQNTVVLSHLHGAIKPLNQLRALEDATIVYRISRAPERRIFYIDVGNLPKMKAEQYLRDMMQRHKNKVVYDASTGEIRDDRKFMTMLEDYWLPRRDGSRGTEISTLPAGQNLGELADVEYFQKKLYESLNVPPSRLQQDGTFMFGNDQEISRDEIKFAKFIDRIHLRFSHLFTEALKKQVLLKNIMTVEDWEAIEGSLSYDYTQDNYFEQQKSASIIRDRANTLGLVVPYVGTYYSKSWVKKNILFMTDDEMEEIDKEIEEESRDPLFMMPMGQDGQGLPGSAAPPQQTPIGPQGGVSSVAPGQQNN